MVGKMTLVFKERYKDEWGAVSNRRELIAEEELKLIFKCKFCNGIGKITEDIPCPECEGRGYRYEIIGTGQGVKNPEITFEDGSMPDFYIPVLKLWVEVTGSDKSQAQSLSICMTKWNTPEPCLFIREGKVEDAKLNRIMSHLIFMSVNEADGSVLFMPCARVVKYPLVEGYEQGGERYYMVPWHDWLRPYKLLEVLK
jgi:RecJ-like exonuclease